MGTLTAGILSLEFRAVLTEPFRIIQVRPKGKLLWINKDLDDLLSHSPVSSVVYFSQSKIRDVEADVPSFLTDIPRLLDVYLINCNRPINKIDCDNYDFKVPGVRFFPSEYKRIQQREKGKEEILKVIENRNKSPPYKLRNFILNALVSVELKTPGSPNFKPILSTDTVASLFRKTACKCISYIVLADQSERGSTVGRDTVLALLKREKILVRIVDNVTFFGNFGLKFLRKDHKLAIIPRFRRPIKLYPKSASGRSFAMAVITFLNEFA
ncbi:uncharacterized protein LOC119560307 [Drosophila subpulchrella]|uniref:uncharacterized protein LOC119560307 n=1 Tax=Drosophila subpulchrella TaxID=1486046 RepID=UPI0018A147B0|nr:uncharacterized protein LOC119560307 [Drosophila subpulchrella]